ncbi:hypothetical protein BKA67DRAFT_287048 [Truncatella angustata]|uniref:Uncharacterized protein n=1 Tax=Truncatella angustata TaxID=152316 RepID=A0A9P8ZXC1_9PEZI|nr:uncharacterized protein BKA67DRAFT_287048 [Truncatella angustata]KAH6654677.1 hypothetical protein BKA67DRAFT_287048 [Truncatella angustata]
MTLGLWCLALESGGVGGLCKPIPGPLIGAHLLQKRYWVLCNFYVRHAAGSVTQKSKRSIETLQRKHSKWQHIGLEINKDKKLVEMMYDGSMWKCPVSVDYEDARLWSRQGLILLTQERPVAPANSGSVYGLVMHTTFSQCMNCANLGTYIHVWSQPCLAIINGILSSAYQLSRRLRAALRL